MVFGKNLFSWAVSPQDINKHVKTSVNILSGAVHYMAPESGLLCLLITITMVTWMVVRRGEVVTGNRCLCFWCVCIGGVSLCVN